ncbi:MAG: radical SAM protein [Bacteroidetes bacterium]|nr:radical SAM protein [Bacteroidota bacterium]MCL5025127.1 radical SAM protein [Chloroflexota bacterium]
MTKVSERSLSIKAKLLTEGIRATPRALAGLGTIHKEQNHGLFGWDFEDHVGRLLPDDFVLSDGTVVQFRGNSGSPYVLDADGDGLALFEGEERLDAAGLIPRPPFYSTALADGTPMVKIAQVGGEDCFFVCYQNYCSHFARGQQCLFCNLVATKETYDSVLTRKQVAQIAEVAAAAFAEGNCKHILLTGGCFSARKEVETVVDIVSAIRNALGVDVVPGTVLPSPATNPDHIRAYREAGIAAIGYSMEIWDEALFRAICPGKSSTTGHRQFVAAIEEAVRVFGPGNVYGVFVLGLEPRDTFLDGVRSLTSIGANVVPFVWSPNPGSRMEGHSAPGWSWYVDVMQEAAEVVARSGVPAGTENHCYRCDGNSMLHDALRLRSIA